MHIQVLLSKRTFIQTKLYAFAIQSGTSLLENLIACLIECLRGIYLNSSSKLGPGCSRVAVASVQSDARSGAVGELPARSVR